MGSYFKLFTPFFPFLLLMALVGCGSRELPILAELDLELEQRNFRESLKRDRILELERELKAQKSPKEQIRILEALCLEYKSYSFDSASRKSQALLLATRRSGDPCLISYAHMIHAYVQLSAGIINPALDSLLRWKPINCDSTRTAQYYFTLSKGYYELSFFNAESGQTGTFETLGHQYLDSAIAFSKPGSIWKASYTAYKSLKTKDYDQARKLYEDLVRRPDLPTRQLAMEAACLASVYETFGEQEKSMEYYARSAIADEISTVREYTSLIRLASQLFEQGDIERSNRYITLSLRDANFFGSLQRKIQILEVLPLIKTQQLSLVKDKQRLLILFSSLLFALLLGCVFLIVLIIRQKNKIRKNELWLEAYSLDLKYKKAELLEAQRIKEQYIGHFFQTNTRIINKIEKIFAEISKGLQNKDLVDIRFHINQFKPDQEKKKLLKEFDKAFLSIFPSFVDDVNALLRPEQKIELDEEAGLTTELRILALMRMGISSNEVIARSLGYSVNTVYTYKTKIRNKSYLASDDFDNAVQGIQSVRDTP